MQRQIALKRKSRTSSRKATREYNQAYSGDHLNRIAFPLGGLGAGMVCLEGAGALSHVSVRHQPNIYNEPCIFAAVGIPGRPEWARVLEGPVPGWKIMFPWGKEFSASGNGGPGKTYGLPHFGRASFLARFPFAEIKLTEGRVPYTVAITGWSPFEPGDADNASLPVAALEYKVMNTLHKKLDGVFSFNARNFMAIDKNPQAVKSIPGGYVLWSGASAEKPWEEGAFSVTVPDQAAKVNCAWFRGGWFDPLTMAWRDVEQAACYSRPPVTKGEAAPGGTIFVPFSLKAGASRTFTVQLAWYVPSSNLSIGEAPKACDCGTACHNQKYYQPWYAGRFKSINAVARYWQDNYTKLKTASQRFSRSFYNTTLPPEVIEAVAANLTILKSPTVLRQKDGSLWGWEGCFDTAGCCHGSCTHVWNYAQALPHLFPELERSLRQTEFSQNQDQFGHQNFRAYLPIRPTDHNFHAAADGQLGGIMKVYREWRLSGDQRWPQEFWPGVKQSLDYCIATWDPKHRGALYEPHHNTYDIEFWGPDGLCCSFYLGALKAAVLMGQALGKNVAFYDQLYLKGRRFLESELFNGEYFFQKIQSEGLRAKPGKTKGLGLNYSPEAEAILKKEGPKYQYGTGCLSDGILGAWMAEVCGLGEIADQRKVDRHLASVFKCNFRSDLLDHANTQRPTYALGKEGGLLVCTWPHGKKPSLPFPYCDEVWTGYEHEVASHLIMAGMVKEGLTVVRAARDRYDGRVRNPFNEYECGHWYARAMSSYALLQGLTGARYDAVEQVLYLRPQIKGDWQAFLSTATGYGTVGMKKGKPFFKAATGRVKIREIRILPPRGQGAKGQDKTKSVSGVST
jgi:uncharacterized protein (DUF608 family)